MTSGGRWKEAIYIAILFTLANTNHDILCQAVRNTGEKNQQIIQAKPVEGSAYAIWIG